MFSPNSFQANMAGKAARMVVVSALLVATLSGCAETAVELITDDTLLLNKANNFYSRLRYNQASEAYRKVMDEYPDSKYRKAAVIGLADSLYKEGQFDESNLYYERFVEMYPMDDMTPRALFYFGMSHMMLTSTADRSQKKTHMARKVFEEFVIRYPDNALAPTAAIYMERMENMLAQSKLEVARFYFRTNKNAAAIGRLTEFIEKNPKSSDIPEAMFILGQSYMREQSYRKAAEVFTILIGNHPKSEWAAKAQETASNLVVKSN
ncbi:MAG: outer membrane protein assembly factor BamD [Nitrospinota bacterium]|nr:outer membrane protein assembly factor BamD [Nitrospinota bacterium]MDH5677978.1 outer membrane protein assembly factor BamD [Nitrospinota bacterium]